MEVVVLGRAMCSLASCPVSIPPSAPTRSKPWHCPTSLRTEMFLREGLVNTHNRVAQRHAVATLQSTSSRGCSEGEEHPAPSGHTQDSLSDASSFRRREVIGKGLSLLMSAISLPALATDEQFTLYEDTEDKYSLLVPQEWTKGEGASGVRKVTAFFPDNDSSAVNVNVVITGLGADFTGLGSFGTADIFAENLVNTLDRAWQKPKGQAAKLIDSRSKNGMYYIEYTLQKPGEAKRHLLSVVGIASNGWINRLYTVTGQYWEGDGDKYKTSLEKNTKQARTEGGYFVLHGLPDDLAEFGLYKKKE